MHYTLCRHPRAKRMSLRLNDQGELILVLPRFVPEIAGKAFVAANKSWILRQRAQLLPVQHYQTRSLKNGSELTFFDQKLYTINIVSTSLKKPKYTLDGSSLNLSLPVTAKCENINHLIETFYRAQAQEYLTARVHFFADKIGEDFNQVKIKNTRSRWGSCSTLKNLNFNWRIMMAPKSVIDYLVVHEVCHLRHMNHGLQFWELVQTLDPDFKAHKQWLKVHQVRLFSFLRAQILT